MSNALLLVVIALLVLAIILILNLRKVVTQLALNDQQLTDIVGTVVSDVATLLSQSGSADDPAVDQAITALTDLDGKIKAAIAANAPAPVAGS